MSPRPTTSAPLDPDRSSSGRRAPTVLLSVVLLSVVLLVCLVLAIARPWSTDPAPAQQEAANQTPVSPQTAAREAEPPAVMPNGTNTGVPAGTTLSDYTGPMTIDRAGTVIDAQTIRGALVIQAPDVSITRSRIIGDVNNENTEASFTISDSTVEAGDRPTTGIGSVNFTARRVQVTGGNRSIFCAKNCVVEYSYVHGQMTDETGTFHESGIRMSQHSTIRFNTIACDAPDVAPDAGCSAALTGYGDFEPVQDNLVQGNLFRHGSGGFCAYGGSSAGKPFATQAARIRFIDNVWERGARAGEKGKPVCGYWGPITDFDPTRPGNVWSGNTFDDGTPIEP